MAVTSDLKELVPQLYRRDFLDTFLFGWMCASKEIDPETFENDHIRSCLEFLGEKGYKKIDNLKKNYRRNMEALKDLRQYVNGISPRDADTVQEKFYELRKLINNKEFIENLDDLVTLFGSASIFGQFKNHSEQINTIIK